MKFQLYRDTANQYRWRLRATNGQIIATSGEGYVSKSDCQHGMNLVRQNAASASIEDLT